MHFTHGIKSYDHNSCPQTPFKKPAYRGLVADSNKWWQNVPNNYPVCENDYSNRLANTLLMQNASNF